MTNDISEIAQNVKRPSSCTVFMIALNHYLMTDWGYAVVGIVFCFSGKGIKTRLRKQRDLKLKADMLKAQAKNKQKELRRKAIVVINCAYISFRQFFEGWGARASDSWIMADAHSLIIYRALRSGCQHDPDPKGMKYVLNHSCTVHSVWYVIEHSIYNMLNHWKISPCSIYLQMNVLENLNAISVKKSHPFLES